MKNNRFIDLFEEVQTRRQPGIPLKSMGKSHFSGAMFSCSGSSRTVQGEEVADPDGFVLKIFDFFFPNHGLTRGSLTPELRDMAAKMLLTATEASDLMDLVPRPPGGVPNFSWLAKEAGRIFRRWLTNDQLYSAVVETVRWKWRSAFEIAKNTSLSQSFGRRFAYQHTAISYRVPGIVPVLAQPSSMSCWATAYTMMYDWKMGQSHDMRQAIANAGSRWLSILDSNTGISGSDFALFVPSVGLLTEPQQSLPITRWLDLLQTYGPIWVVFDMNPSPQQAAIHARLLTGIEGDATPEGTHFNIIDPNGGREYRETFRLFDSRYGEAAPYPIQIIHWPAGVSRQQSFSGRHRSFSDDKQAAELDGIDRNEREDIPLTSYSASMEAADYCPLNRADDASTTNFRLHEFTSRDGEEVPVSVRGNVQHLMNQLEVLRADVGRTIHITSGYRSDAHNRRVGGEARSRHRCGQAADIQIPGMTPQEVKDTIERLIAAGQMVQGGIGLYNTFVHYDTFAPNGRGRRW